MAFKLLKKGGVVVIDDMGRPIEKQYAFHYFGEENLVDFIEKKVGIFQNSDKILKWLIKNITIIWVARV